jgi:16S rRNA (uracil1498-N3)-methyltransferase
MLAEKAAELGATSWRPVLWRRSKSVSPRGEGSGFQAKARARMIAALEQSGNAWLPALYPDAKLEHALAAVPAGPRFVLDAGGASLVSLAPAGTRGPVTLALGPEGGLDESELAALADAGFVRAALAPTILRFETAGIAALAHARAVVTETEELHE